VFILVDDGHDVMASGRIVSVALCDFDACHLRMTDNFFPNFSAGSCSTPKMGIVPSKSVKREQPECCNCFVIFC
jgi:hypothetical protein